MSWVSKIEPILITTLKTKLVKKFGEKYPTLNTSVTNVNATKITNFPTVYFHKMLSPTFTSDLERNRIDGVYYTFQLEVISKDQQTTDELMDYCVDVFVKLGFSVITPELADNADTFRQVARFSKNISYEEYK